MRNPRPLVDARIYPGSRRRGRYARLLVFVTKREMRAYLRRRKRPVTRDTAAMCSPIHRWLHVDRRVPRTCFAELVFSAGFDGRANEFISHECLHALLRLRTDAQIASALDEMDDEERFMAYPLGRMVSRTVAAIYAAGDGIVFHRPVGAALKAMRAVVRRRA